MSLCEWVAVVGLRNLADHGLGKLPAAMPPIESISVATPAATAATAAYKLPMHL
jgi:hypothetical protein